MAAAVEFCRLRRSSRAVSICRPYLRPVGSMNCQNPMAPLGEPACGRSALSAMATYFRSSGSSWRFK